MIFDDVKTALRITHSALDSEINQNISAARAELVRAGVDATKAASDDALIVRAIKTYVLSFMTENIDDAAKYAVGFNSQLDNIRKTVGYEPGNQAD